MNLSRRSFLQSAAALAASAAPASPRRPNIIVILADDLGFSDIGCHGGEIATPHLDNLARRGVRFTQFYNTARCCPTRASLLSGLYAHQAGVGHMMDDRSLPGYRGDLSRRCVTIAEVLRGAGYRTLMCGKWHVTPPQNKSNWPLQRGFQHFYGTIHGGGSYYDPVTLTRDNSPASPGSPGFYYTDALSEQAARWVAEYAGQQPFFLYLAYTSPHWPLHALESDSARYRGRYQDGWDALRAERHPRMVKMGIVDRRWPLTQRDPTVPAWSDAPHKQWQQRRMEVYAAQVDRMDQGIGRVLDALRKSGAENDTLVLFLADNGGCAEELSPQSKGLHIPAATRDGRPVRVGNLTDVMPGPDDTYQSYGIGWANASNSPFRLYKHWVHEGGISTPFIARWPAVIREGNRLSHHPAHLIDIMATCVEAAGARYPAAYEGNAILPMEGRSLLPAFQARAGLRDRPIFWEHEGNRAVRKGRWKLVSRYPGRWELYDLEADRTEMRDLSASHPSAAEELAAEYDNWASRAHVAPWDQVRKS